MQSLTLPSTNAPVAKTLVCDALVKTRAAALAGGGPNLSLHGLRGLAAFLVLVFHIEMMGGHGGFWPELPKLHWIKETGPLAVRLFFFISGFLIISSLSRNGNLKRFFVNRLLRVFPLFVILHLVMFTLGPLMNYHWVGEGAGDGMGRLLHDPLAWVGHFFSNLFLLPGLLELPIAQQNSWSLSYEFVFYGVAAFMFHHQRRHADTLWGRAVWYLSWLGIGWACFNDHAWTYFVGGVGVWWVIRRFSLRLSGYGPLDLLALVFGFWLFLLGQWVFAVLVLSFFFASVVQETGWTSRLLQTPVMGFLGKISYSLYLVHPFALDALRRLLHFGMPDHGPIPYAAPLFWVAGPCIAIMASWVTYELIEKRLTEWLKSRWVRC
jgi:peptidoglycan/LPS O-acetylase OafA/YrhL